MGSRGKSSRLNRAVAGARVFSNGSTVGSRGPSFEMSFDLLLGFYFAFVSR